MSVYEIVSNYLDGLIGHSIIVEGWRKPRVLKSWYEGEFEESGFYFRFESGEKKYVGVDDDIRIVDQPPAPATDGEE